jgi:predicted RNase H-like HicB family nuclease
MKRWCIALKYVYPAIFTPLPSGEYDVRVPDLPGCITCGKNLADAIEMAGDAIAMWLCDAEDNQETIPLPSENITVEHPQFVNLVIADTDEYRRENDNRAVKKTLTIPNWLNSKAEKAGVNFPQTLQTALKNQLNISEQPRKVKKQP